MITEHSSIATIGMPLGKPFHNSSNNEEQKRRYDKLRIDYFNPIRRTVQPDASYLIRHLRIHPPQCTIENNMEQKL